MATITATLRKDQPDREGRCRVVLLYRNSNEPAVKHSIGEKVLPKQFDFDKQLVVNHERSDEINHLINQQRQLLNNIAFDIRRNGDIPTTRLVKSMIKSYEDKQKSKQLIDYPNELDKEGQKDYGWGNQKRTPAEAWKQLLELKKNVVTKETLGIYRTTFDHLATYCKNHNRKLDWDMFDGDFYNYWSNYFIEECENQYGDMGLANNTIGKYFKTLKQFLNWAVEKEYHTNLKYKKYKIIQEEVDIHPLSESDIARIVAFCDNEKNDKRLRRVASLFVFLATTGLRFSDGQNLRWSDLFYTGEGDIEQQVLRVTTQKTNQKLLIPLSDYSLTELVRNASDFESGKKLIHEVLKPNQGLFDYGDIRKYFANESEVNLPLLPQISSVKFNKYIKEVAKACGFVEPITVIRKIGSRTDRRTFKRWEKISSHDCRRTFITLSLSKGMRPEMVMAFTGHKSFKTMLRYNKLTEKVKVKEFQETWGMSRKHYDDWLGSLEVSIGKSKYDTDEKNK